MDNIRIETYLMDQGEMSEAARYEKEFVERHEKDLNVTLAVVRPLYLLLPQLI